MSRIEASWRAPVGCSLGGGAGNRTPVRRYFGGGISERSRWRAFRRSDSIGE